jgi:segregation and condensation protein A
VGVFSLFEAFEKLLKRTNVKIDHEVVFDRITITDRIVELTERMSERRRCTFEDLILNDPTRQGTPLTRFDVVITFLAILEMARMRLIRVYQSDPLAPIHLEMTMTGESTDDDAGHAAVSKESDGLPAEVLAEDESGQTEENPEQLLLFEDDDVVEGAEDVPDFEGDDSEVEDGN